jgi:two-component system nitrogen regulation response regulator GlnG
MREPRVLIVDDDEALLYSLCRGLANEPFRCVTASSGASALEVFRADPADVVLLDNRLHDMSGLDVLRDIRQLDSDVPVVMFTAFSTTATTIEATKLGAFEYLVKPVDLRALKAILRRALARRPARLDEDVTVEATSAPLGASTGTQLIGSCAPMREVYKQIGRFAGTSGNVLILGESGTGKELVARAIHEHSARSDRRFLAINCAALSETLLESELFGHERGAFTGADKRRVGKFEYADGGTIFLDEIGDMSPATQAKVLRLLQDQRFERLGGNEAIATDVRILAATNQDLERLVGEGRFREDLYYRLAVFTIDLPPLRERSEDLPELFQYFVAIFGEEFAKSRVRIEPAVFAVLRRHAWPGNMRELQSVVKHALAHTTGQFLTVDCLPPALLGQSADKAVVAESVSALVASLLDIGASDIYRRVVSRVDEIVVARVLAHVDGNLLHASELLGISRNTLKAKMRGQRLTTDGATTP